MYSHSSHPHQKSDPSVPASCGSTLSPENFCQAVLLHQKQMEVLERLLPPAELPASERLLCALHRLRRVLDPVDGIDPLVNNALAEMSFLGHMTAATSQALLSLSRTQTDWKKHLDFVELVRLNSSSLH